MPPGPTLTWRTARVVSSPFARAWPGKASTRAMAAITASASASRPRPSRRISSVASPQDRDIADLLRTRALARPHPPDHPDRHARGGGEGESDGGLGHQGADPPQ